MFCVLLKAHPWHSSPPCYVRLKQGRESSREENVRREVSLTQRFLIEVPPLKRYSYGLAEDVLANALGTAVRTREVKEEIGSSWENTFPRALCPLPGAAVCQQPAPGSQHPR